MAKDDARYTGSFFNSYTNTRMKLHRHCVPLDDDAEKISRVYGYPRQQVEQIFHQLKQDLQAASEKMTAEFQSGLDEKLGSLAGSLVFIGDQLTSEYLSYYNILRAIFSKYGGIKMSIAGNTGDTSNQSLQYIYGLAVSQRPLVTSIFIGTNDVFYSKDAYKKTISSRSEFRDNVDYLTKVMLHNGSKVILNTLPPVDENAASKAYAHMNWGVDNEEIKRRNEIIRDIAKTNRCTLNDIEAGFTSFDGRVNLQDNGVLLTKEAQLFIARQFLPVLLGQL